VGITTIAQALTGERVVALSPENAGEAATDWLRRPNLFPGRALTVATLEERQRWQAGHIAQRGQAFTPGVARGLEVGYVAEGVDADGHAIVRLRIGAGQGLTVSGEDVVLVRQVDCLLSALPVVAPPSAFADVLDHDEQGVLEDHAAQNADPTPGAPLPRAIGPTLGELFAAPPDRLPPVGILVLQPVTVDTADLEHNVEAGVAFFAYLVHQAKGDVSLAVAGYYQGLRSVVQKGIQADTKRYVANVMALRQRFSS